MPIGEPSVYDASNLWDAINGAADLHLDYGFSELSVQKFRVHQRDVEIESFDQGSPVNAFGIFRRERPKTATPLTVGGEGALSLPYTCAMWKGRYLVRIRVTEGELDASLCEEALYSFAKRLDGEDGLPGELSALPEENRVPLSEGYTPNGYLGVSELPRALHATYQVSAEKKFVLFALLGTDEAQTKTFESIKAKWTRMDGHDAYHRKIPYLGPTVVVQTEKGIFGVQTDDNPSAALDWLRKLL